MRRRTVIGSQVQEKVLKGHNEEQLEIVIWALIQEPGHQNNGKMKIHIYSPLIKVASSVISPTSCALRAAFISHVQVFVFFYYVNL
jgi:hypothetical protein